MATLTVYSEPGVTVDGYLQGTGDYNGTAWGTLVAAAGTSADYAGTDLFCAAMYSGAVSDWWFIRRAIFLFDTSAIPDAATISGAVVSLYGQQKSDGQGRAPNVDIYTSTPASNTTLAAGDYAQIGSTSQTGSPITYANWSTAGYNDFTFNATGISNISKTGVSKFGARNANYDVANSAPTWGAASSISHLNAWPASTAGTTKDPKLVVTYTSSSIKTFNGIASASVKTINGIAIASVKTWGGIA
jgi:hypothetical protein